MVEEQISHSDFPTCPELIDDDTMFLESLHDIEGVCKDKVEEIISIQNDIVEQPIVTSREAIFYREKAEIWF